MPCCRWHSSSRWHPPGSPTPAWFASKPSSIAAFPVNPIFAAALEAQDLCRAKRWAFCIIGAVAAQRWGEPRLTQDVDLTVVAGFGAEGVYVDALLATFAGRRDDTRDFALRHRVVLLRSQAGVPIDVALGAIPFEERMVARVGLHDRARHNAPDVQRGGPRALPTPPADFARS